MAEDAVARLPVTDPETALDAATPVIHPELGDNLAFTLELHSGDIDRAFTEADQIYRDTFWMGRHTGVTVEPRTILADFDPSERRLTVYHSFQAPHMMQDILARHLGLAEQNVRVITKDVGGSFGIKVHIYPDEMATCALAVLLGRPVKFVADRLMCQYRAVGHPIAFAVMEGMVGRRGGRAGARSRGSPAEEPHHVGDVPLHRPHRLLLRAPLPRGGARQTPPISDYRALCAAVKRPRPSALLFERSSANVDGKAVRRTFRIVDVVAFAEDAEY